MSQRHPALQFTHPLPYGAILHDGGVQFVVFSRSATAMRVLLYDGVDDREPTEIIAFDREPNRWGDIWSVFVPGTRAGQLYHFQADGPFDPQRGQRFDPQARLIDPYARRWPATSCRRTTASSGRRSAWWSTTSSIGRATAICGRSLADTVIYEMHVRGFTQSPSSERRASGHVPGRDRKDSLFEVAGRDGGRADAGPRVSDPTTAWGKRAGTAELLGLRPAGFFSPHRGYAAGNEPGCQVNEFKQMVRALHQAGIEVILDVVFNHTAEGNEHGPTLSFKGLENRVYYMLGNGGEHYRNYSGCGNTVNGNHPIVREMIFLCLRHWVHNYHVDGFRFDLASILSRDRNGDLVPNPPVVEAIAEDPLLADTKIIAEAWDAAGAYQVGSFANLRWAEWNGRYRDDVRRFWRGDPRHDRPAGHAAGRLERSVSGRRAAAVSQHQLHHLARRLHAERPGQLQRTSTTKTTARATATATTTTTATTTAAKARRRGSAIETVRVCGRSRTCWPRSCSARACRCCSPATNAGGRSAATTTPIARTTRFPGSTGRWWSETSR